MKATLPFLLLFAFPAWSQGSDLQRVAGEARGATVQIHVQFVEPGNVGNVCNIEADGSGLIISGSGYVLSVAHTFSVPADCDLGGLTRVLAKARIGYRESGEQFTMTPIGPPDTEMDVSMWKLPERSEPYQAMAICNEDKIDPGEQLFALGFPRDQTDYSPIPTTFSNTGGPGGLWVVSSDLTYGFSGGPVLNATGSAVGLAQGGVANTPAVRYVIPMRHAVNRLLMSGIELTRCDLADESAWSEFGVLAQIQAQAACIGLSTAERGSHFVLAIPRLCAAGDASPCPDICNNIKKYTTFADVTDSNYKVIGSLHIYPSGPPSTEPNRIGLMTYIYRPDSPLADQPFCGPNYCCCSQEQPDYQN